MDQKLLDFLFEADEARRWIVQLRNRGLRSLIHMNDNPVIQEEFQDQKEELEEAVVAADDAQEALTPLDVLLKKVLL
jgi:hypothetical protein